jgi:DNA mismatch endonuclease (patch repair protein)
MNTAARPRRTPPPSSEQARRRMTATRRRDTAAELALRSALHRAGLRFFVDRAPVPGLRRRADLVFPKKRIAVFVDGCFWHSCPQHGTLPKQNAAWWRDKLSVNQARDRDTDQRLRAEGWTTIRVWEHEPVGDAVRRVRRAIEHGR